MSKLGFKKVEGSNVPLYEGHFSYRDGISAILSEKQKDENTPIEIDLTVSPEESQGLSEFEKPHLIGIVQGSDGIIFVKQKYVDEWQELEIFEDCIPEIYEYLMFEL